MDDYGNSGRCAPISDPFISFNDSDDGNFPNHSRTIPIKAAAPGVADGTAEGTEHIGDYSRDNQTDGE